MSGKKQKGAAKAETPSKKSSDSDSSKKDDASNEKQKEQEKSKPKEEANKQGKSSAKKENKGSDTKPTTSQSPPAATSDTGKSDAKSTPAEAEPKSGGGKNKKKSKNNSQPNSEEPAFQPVTEKPKQEKQEENSDSSKGGKRHKSKGGNESRPSTAKPEESKSEAKASQDAGKDGKEKQGKDKGKKGDSNNDSGKDNKGDAKQSDSKSEERVKGAGQEANKYKNRTKLNCTALHVLKGAVVKVLGERAAVTSSVAFNGSAKGELHIVLQSGEAPTDDEKLAIQAAANQIIQLNLDVKQFKMDRQAAEVKYKANPVNHTYIYDQFPVPETVKELTLVEIQNWNVNCCTAEHLERTGALEALWIMKMSYRAAKNRVEFMFAVGPAAVEALTSNVDSSPSTTTITTKAKPTQNQFESKATSAPDQKGSGNSGNTAGKAGGKSKKGSNSASPADDLFANWTPSKTSPVQAFTTELLDTLLLPTITEVLTGVKQETKSDGASGKKNKGKDKDKGASAATTSGATASAVSVSGGIELTPEKLAQLRAALAPKLEAELNMFQSAAYTRGFSAKLPANYGTPL